MNVVDRYLDEFFSETPRLEVIRSLLADDFWFRGPLISADSADDYISQLTAMRLGGLRAENRLILTSEPNVFAVLYDLVTPSTTLPTSEWFWIINDHIAGIKLLNDPRALLESW